ncbi:hypothetical protein KGD82_16510 [Nocardiopsis eucommiae]|uniref:Uncharacterized protein n=1 Tax=Nocardiopsis eucommiae TaxID=2831970 RepID=A0A975L7X5_9ACTN|nr:hypothetical protein KGD82_16510 [Nocardiopsis eucommiae]
MTTTAPTHIPSINSVLQSPLWFARERARLAYLDAHTAFLWHRAIWRANPTPVKHTAYKEAEDAERAALHHHNQVDGAVFSRLMKRGVDVDALPADRDDCSRCKTTVVEGFGCDCTNVLLALELG